MCLILNYCCCCYDLKSGALVIGIIVLIVDIFTIIHAGIFYCIDKGILETYYPIEKKNISDLKIILIFSVGALVIFFTLLMILGSWKNKYKCMLPYLMIKSITLTMGFIFSWYVIVTNFMANTMYGCFYFFFLNAATALTGYFWLVVYSRSKEILIENKKEMSEIKMVRRVTVLPR